MMCWRNYRFRFSQVTTKFRHLISFFSIYRISPSKKKSGYWPNRKHRHRTAIVVDDATPWSTNWFTDITCIGRRKDTNNKRVIVILVLPLWISTAQEMNFPVLDFFSKCDQIRSFLRIRSRLLKKSLIENYIFYAV